MRLVSVNVGKPMPINTKERITGIFKLPQEGAVEIGDYGLRGDAIIDKKHHGGLDQAVYIYGQPDYDWWMEELGQALEPGTFGDNLTISELESATFLIGDRLKVGEVELEITAPRNPCNTLATRMGDPHFVRRFHKAQRPGLYARVLKTGIVRAGDPVGYERFAGEAIPVTELTEDYKNPAPDRMRWLLKAPIHRDLREQYEEALAAKG
jgi:MOSC domain-containing protein YiiM